MYRYWRFVWNLLVTRIYYFDQDIINNLLGQSSERSLGVSRVCPALAQYLGGLQIPEINQIFLSQLEGKIHQFLLFFVRTIDILYIGVDSSSSDLFQRSLETLI